MPCSQANRPVIRCSALARAGAGRLRPESDGPHRLHRGRHLARLLCALPGDLNCDGVETVTRDGPPAREFDVRSCTSAAQVAARPVCADRSGYIAAPVAHRPEPAVRSRSGNGECALRETPRASTLDVLRCRSSQFSRHPWVCQADCLPCVCAVTAARWHNIETRAAALSRQHSVGSTQSVLFGRSARAAVFGQLRSEQHCPDRHCPDRHCPGGHCPGGHWCAGAQASEPGLGVEN
jgi:hypothetical protein